MAKRKKGDLSVVGNAGSAMDDAIDAANEMGAELADELSAAPVPAGGKGLPAVDAEREEMGLVPDEPVADRNGQVAMFQKDAKIDGLTHDIAECYDAATRAVKSVGEHARFFKRFADLTGSVDPSVYVQAVRTNVEMACERAGHLAAELQTVVQHIDKAEELEAKLLEVTNEKKSED